MGVLPDWWEFALVALASFRAWRLLAEDDMLERPRKWILRRASDKQTDFLICVWCAGAWISLLAYLIWMATLGEWPATAGEGLVAVGVWFAVSAAVGLVRQNLDEE